MEKKINYMHQPVKNKSLEATTEIFLLVFFSFALQTLERLTDSIKMYKAAAQEVWLPRRRRLYQRKEDKKRVLTLSTEEKLSELHTRHN